jgi:hypothetical protein
LIIGDNGFGVNYRYYLFDDFAIWAVVVHCHYHARVQIVAPEGYNNTLASDNHS